MHETYSPLSPCPLARSLIMVFLVIRLAAFHTCEPTVFTCGNGRCVPYHYRCDHYNDCGDNSDEVGCLFRLCDPNTEFPCNNGRCIAKDYVCNGINNCFDNGTSDEQNCRKSTQQDLVSDRKLKCQSIRIGDVSSVVK